MAVGQAVRRSGGLAVGIVSILTARPPDRLSAQSLDALTLRFTAFTAVSGYEDAVRDSLLALLPGATRDRFGNILITLGTGGPARLVSCPLDEPGYVVGAITPDGYLTLHRDGRVTSPLFDQQLEGQRVTVFGRNGAVPGVVGVRSVHLTRGRGANDAPFTADNAYVDVGAASAAEITDLGIAMLSPVALTKAPHPYGSGLLAAPIAGRRAACAALAAAALRKPKAQGTVVVAFTIQSLQGGNPGLSSVIHARGPFADTLTAVLPSKYPETAAETVSLDDARALEQRLLAWIGGAK
jgi:putative aminopeptidase FrvX